jgi:6-phosphogluconolactonase (cycloisomerase 2 family)
MHLPHKSSHRIRTLLAVLAMLAASLVVGAVPAVAAPDSGAVFTLSNDAGGNTVLVFARAADGTLTQVDEVATGGLGSGGGLGSQGALTLSDNGHWLLAVNAGSDSVSLFRVSGTHLQLKNVADTQGHTPISVDVHRNLAFVVNAGSETIEGFRIGYAGLTSLPNSERALSGTGVGPAQIEFSPNGRALVVTEKATNQIVAYRVGRFGWVSEGVASASAGETPFGFEFDRRGRIVVSEAFGGAPGEGVVSTYRVGAGQASVVDTEETTQTAACWIAISENGHYVYTTNTGSDSVTTLRLNFDGTLTVLDQTAVGDAPIDVDFSNGDHYLYVLNGAGDSISVLSAGSDGILAPVETITGLPGSGVGLAAS